MTPYIILFGLGLFVLIAVWWRFGSRAAMGVLPFCIGWFVVTSALTYLAFFYMDWRSHGRARRSGALDHAVSPVGRLVAPVDLAGIVAESRAPLHTL